MSQTTSDSPAVAGGDNELAKLMREAPEPEGEHAETPEGEEGHAPRRRRRGGAYSEKTIRELNLTAMMDMMTIILVFLLKNYSADEDKITMSDELRPPESTAKIPMEPAVTITVTTKGILVSNKVVVTLNPDGSVAGEAAGAAGPIPDLQTVLTDKVAGLKEWERRGGPPFEGKLLVVADKSVQYSLLMRVLYTAGVAQFSQYKLVVRAEGGKTQGGI